MSRKGGVKQECRDTSSRCPVCGFMCLNARSLKKHQRRCKGVGA